MTFDGGATAAAEPWFESVHRWGMTNISERDVADYDVGFWQEQWERTGLQAVIANAVAGFATYPIANSLIPRSRFAPCRDLLGEIRDAVAESGMILCARMDSQLVSPDALDAYSDWRVLLPDGTRTKHMCINSPYREEFVYPLYKEIIDRYGVKGFTDNGGVGASTLCHCGFCKKRWGDEVGGSLPTAASLADAAYRDWLRWSDKIVLENWEQSDEYIRTWGGSDCLFLGLARKFSPFNHAVARRARLILMDCQSRNDSGTFREHVDEGRYMKGILGWDHNVAVASSMTQHSHGYFRLTSDPAAEARMYLLSGIAGGFDPWWHHPTAYSPDRRSYDIAGPVFEWHAENSDALHHRTPLVTVGVVRSAQNDQFFGRDIGPFYQPRMMGELTQATYRGACHLLFDAGVPYRPVDLADLGSDPLLPGVLVLPNLAGISDDDCASIAEYVRAGGALIATGMTSLFDEDGEPRKEFGLAGVLGVRVAGPRPERDALATYDAAGALELRPDAEIAFAESDVVSRYEGTAVRVSVDADRRVVAVTGSDSSPAIVAGEYGRGRVVYMPLDLDRRYLREPQPAHAAILERLVRWCTDAEFPVVVECSGTVGAYLYEKDQDLVLHLLNYSGVDTMNSLSSTPSAVSNLEITVAAGSRGACRVRSLTRDAEWTMRATDGRLRLTLDEIVEQEVLVISPIVAESAAGAAS